MSSSNDRSTWTKVPTFPGTALRHMDAPAIATFSTMSAKYFRLTASGPGWLSTWNYKTQALTRQLFTGGLWTANRLLQRSAVTGQIVESVEVEVTEKFLLYDLRHRVVRRLGLMLLMESSGPVQTYENDGLLQLGAHFCTYYRKRAHPCSRGIIPRPAINVSMEREHPDSLKMPGDDQFSSGVYRPSRGSCFSRMDRVSSLDIRVAAGGFSRPMTLCVSVAWRLLKRRNDFLISLLYGTDMIGFTQLMQLMEVDCRATAPSGIGYKLIVVPELRAVYRGVVEKLLEFVDGVCHPLVCPGRAARPQAPPRQFNWARSSGLILVAAMFSILQHQ
ncbi:hypothetical protein EV421DRAFT_1737272 [Armillaria borealis]|uniref:F5/8 type C domain-containing protein n=1 Tax=Armillaria borealis TaxID=47425 RepID=A0AA39MNV8_9AGAR|nr:hypothetical protein EV421DRAFT_1737272 [Armillaria borealis]